MTASAGYLAIRNYTYTPQESFTNIQYSLGKYGFAVVWIGVKKDNKNSSYISEQIKELSLLIDKIRSEGLNIVKINEINQHITLN